MTQEIKKKTNEEHQKKVDYAFALSSKKSRTLNVLS